MATGLQIYNAAGVLVLDSNQTNMRYVTTIEDSRRKGEYTNPALTTGTVMLFGEFRAKGIDRNGHAYEFWDVAAEGSTFTAQGDTVSWDAKPRLYSWQTGHVSLAHQRTIIRVFLI